MSSFKLLSFVRETQELGDDELQKMARVIELEQQRRLIIMRARLEEASSEYTRTQAPVLSYPISELISEKEHEEGLIIY